LAQSRICTLTPSREPSPKLVLSVRCSSATCSPSTRPPSIFQAQPVHGRGSRVRGLRLFHQEHSSDRSAGIPSGKAGRILGAPSSVHRRSPRWGAHRLDLFAKGTDQQFGHRWWDGTAWHGWQTLGGQFKDSPAAVSWGSNRIDVFVRGMDDHLGHLWWNGSS